MDKIELRIADLDFTSNDEHELVVEGIVNDGNWSQVLGSRRKFKERIEKGAFSRAINRALKNNGKIDFLSEHDPSKVLSSTVNDSLTLWEDPVKGLCMRAIICPTSWGKDTFQLIKSGIIKSMSFGFNVLEDKWSDTRSEVATRVVKDLNLLEVSAVRNPAYISSVISARGMELVEDVEVGEEDVKVQEQCQENRQGEEEVKPQETVVANEDVSEVEEVVNNAQNVNVSNSTENIETIMKRMFEQFESILSNYAPVKKEVEDKPAEEVVEDSSDEAVNQDDVNTSEKDEKTGEIEESKEELKATEQEDVKEETVNEDTKSQIDYAIELLSKYKKIQELQK